MNSMKTVIQMLVPNVSLHIFTCKSLDCAFILNNYDLVYIVNKSRFINLNNLHNIMNLL